MVIKTSDNIGIKSFVQKLNLLKPNSHKGQNGRVLVIGGSSLFHSASIWAAEIAAHFVDIVHYSSTEENNKIFLSLKKKFRNGIIVHQKDLLKYISEDDSILIGPGMVRAEGDISKIDYKINDIKEVKNIEHEGLKTYFLTEYLLSKFPRKRWVIDAGALQMMKKEWLLKLKVPAIITPHQKEFERLFGYTILDKSTKEKEKIVLETAKKYRVTILLKAIVDIISDGKETVVVEGGNQGLTKGGSGDLLAGLVLGFFAKNQPMVATVLASYLLKKSADRLYRQYRYWYNIDKLINIIPQTMSKL